MTDDGHIILPANIDEGVTRTTCLRCGMPVRRAAPSARSREYWKHEPVKETR